MFQVETGRRYPLQTSQTGGPLAIERMGMGKEALETSLCLQMVSTLEGHLALSSKGARGQGVRRVGRLKDLDSPSVQPRLDFVPEHWPWTQQPPSAGEEVRARRTSTEAQSGMVGDIKSKGEE